MLLKSLSRLIGLVLAMLPLSATADDANRIDLKLFGQNVIQGWDGCSFGLWQDNRNPVEDKYAYVFFAPIPDGEALPGWVKIGDDVIEVSKVDIGSADTGMLEPFRLYRSGDDKLTVMMEIIDQSRSDRGIEINNALLTFLRKDKFPFSSQVKGLNGCPGAADVSDASETEDISAASSGSGLTLGREVPSDSLDQVPPAVMRAIADYGSLCDPYNTPGYSTSYAVSVEITLWQVPCNVYSYNGTSVFAASWASSSDYAVVLSFPSRPDKVTADTIEVPNAVVSPTRAEVAMSSLDSGGDCGEFSLYRLILAPGETIEFELQEHRAKTSCDGVQSDPSTFPLIYESR